MDIPNPEQNKIQNTESTKNSKGRGLFVGILSLAIVAWVVGSAIYIKYYSWGSDAGMSMLFMVPAAVVAMVGIFLYTIVSIIIGAKKGKSLSFGLVLSLTIGAAFLFFFFWMSGFENLDKLFAFGLSVLLAMPFTLLIGLFTNIQGIIVILLVVLLIWRIRKRKKAESLQQKI